MAAGQLALCVDGCKHKGIDEGDMIRCTSWFHEECVGIQCDADRGGVWPCPECRQNGTRVKTLIGTIEGLVSAVRVIGEQLATSERERRDERIRTEERAMALRKEVVTLKEQVATLTWRTFRQPGQPSSLLIGTKREPGQAGRH